MIECKLSYYREKLQKDRLKFDKLETIIENLSELPPNEVDKYNVTNSDRLLQSKIKRIEAHGDIVKSNDIIGSLDRLQSTNSVNPFTDNLLGFRVQKEVSNLPVKRNLPIKSVKKVPPSKFKGPYKIPLF